MDRNGPTLSFEDATKLEQIDSHTYTGSIPVEYSFGQSSHGGFTTAVLQVAVKKHFATTLSKQQQDETISVHIEWLRAAVVGSVEIKLKELRLGKTTSTVQATLSQEGKEKAFIIATNANSKKNLRGLSAPEYRKLLPDEVRPIDYDAALQNKDKNWLRVDNIRIRGRPNHASTNYIYVVPRQPMKDIRTFNFWTCCRNPNDFFSTSQLGLLFDHNMPATEAYFAPETAGHAIDQISARAVKYEQEGKSSYDHPPWLSHRWYTTLNMSIDIKRPVEEGEKWWLLRGETTELLNGRFDIHAEIWSSKRELVAVAQSQWATGTFPAEVIAAMKKAMLGYPGTAAAKM